MHYLAAKGIVFRAGLLQSRSCPSCHDRLQRDRLATRRGLGAGAENQRVGCVDCHDQSLSGSQEPTPVPATCASAPINRATGAIQVTPLMPYMYIVTVYRGWIRTGSGIAARCCCGDITVPATLRVFELLEASNPLVWHVRGLRSGTSALPRNDPGRKLQEVQKCCARMRLDAGAKLKE